MAGSRRGALRRRRERLRLIIRRALPLAAALAVLSLTPVPASATPSWKTSVTPLLDCVQQNRDGSYTAVVGYSSSYSTTVSIPRGSNNHITPSTYDGPQPTVFRPGTQHGVFAVTVSGHDAAYANPTWYVDGNSLSGWGVSLSASCPLPTQLPAQGNDTGAAIALLAAGLLGVLVVVRLRRRALAAAVPAAAAVGEHAGA
jgi:hypothetical protein